MKVLAIAALLFGQSSAADICEEGKLCEGHDETSLMQVKHTLKSQSQHLSNQSLEIGPFPTDRVMESIEHCFVKRGVADSSGKMCCKQKGFDAIILDKCRGQKEPVDWGECGGFPGDVEKSKKTKMYMHSGTAVNYYKCRDGLNDIDLWIPSMTSLLLKSSKVPLAKAFSLTSKAVKWEKDPGMTDKNVSEHGDQTYCPEEKVKGKDFKEMDAFVGTGKERNENGVHVYPKFNIGKFKNVASNGVKDSRLVKAGKNFDLYVIGVCDLISLKVALINGGRKNDKGQDETKETDIEDLGCLCEAHGKEAKKAPCYTQCQWFYTGCDGKCAKAAK